MMLSIGAFSRFSGLSIKALRLYDDIQVLRPANVDRKTGYRRYDLAQIADAHRILALRQMGMSLGAVQRSDGGRGDLLAVKRTLETQLEALAVQLATVNEALAGHDVGHTPPAIALKRVPAMRVVGQRTDAADFDEVDGLLEELCTSSPSSVGGAIWHDCGAHSGRVDAEIFLLTPGPRRPVKENVRELPAIWAASCFHGPGHGAAAAAYVAIQSWLHRSGYRRSGPYRENYFRINGQHSLTEVQLPILSIEKTQ